MNRPSIKELMLNSIEATGNPVAPLVLQNLYSALSSASPLFQCEKADITACSERLLKDFPEEELNVLCSQPEFIRALIILLRTSLIHFGSKPAEKLDEK